MASTTAPSLNINGKRGAPNARRLATTSSVQYSCNDPAILNAIRSIKCVGYDLKAYPSKHFSYVIEVKWAGQHTVSVIHRRYSQFFDLQCRLLDTFHSESIKDLSGKRTLPYLPGKQIFGNFDEKTAVKRMGKLDAYLKGILACPKIANSSLFIKFCEIKQSDLTYLTEANIYAVPICNSISGPVTFPKYRVIATYSQTKTGELSVKADSIVFVLERKFTGWSLVQTVENGEQGWVPSTYLEALDEEIAKAAITSPSHNMCVAICDIEGSEQDELSVFKGAVVEVLKQTYDGWWICRYGEKVGVIPSVYLKKANSSKAQAIISATELLYANPCQIPKKTAPPRPPKPPTKPSRPLKPPAIKKIL